MQNFARFSPNICNKLSRFFVHVNLGNRCWAKSFQIQRIASHNIDSLHKSPLSSWQKIPPAITSGGGIPNSCLVCRRSNDYSHRAGEIHLGGFRVFGNQFGPVISPIRSQVPAHHSFAAFSLNRYSQIRSAWFVAIHHVLNVPTSSSTLDGKGFALFARHVFEVFLKFHISHYTI